ncbi:MAG: cobalamin-binding protein [Flavobacteriia bacterium]|jgi:ABC-type Fe3+-hydroxamate transport system substrate-binding protein|nr:cobalamin-binding protein [Flavobacteriia bacterium]NBO62322.1 cobalamin-binding protein [Flavobacteriia bacterium]
MPKFTDQLGSVISIPRNPKRIISLVPSITEFLYALGMEERVVGITKFCIYPEIWFQTKTRIGGTKTPDFDRIKALTPDLIIGNKEENQEDDINRLRELAPVYMSDVNSIEDMYEMIRDLASILGVEAKGPRWVEQWEAYFKSNRTKGQGKKALYVIWKDPIMVVGKNTYIDSYLTAIGYENCVKEARYPVWSEIVAYNPEVVLLSTEPYPFKETDFEYFKTLFPKAEVALISGEECSWYGVRNVI